MGFDVNVFNDNVKKKILYYYLRTIRFLGG